MNVNSFLKSIREGHDPSKAEEREFVQAIVDAFTVNDRPYLHSLFNGVFLNWTCRRINDDWSLDLMGELEVAIRGNDSTLQAVKAERADLLSENIKLKELVGKLEKDFQTSVESTELLDRRLAERDEEIQALLDQIEALEGTVDRVKKLTFNAWLSDSGVDPRDLKEVL